MPAARAMDIGVYGARSIPSTYSGYETFLTTLLPGLVDRGHQVTMYCRATEEDPDRTPYRGVRRVVLPAVAGKQFNTLSHGAVASVRARIARHDVVLVVNVANAVFCAIARWTGQPVVLNTDGQEWLRGKWGRAGRAYFKGSARISRFAATALVSDCAAMADLYEREFKAQSTVIPYCSPGLELATDVDVLASYGVTPGEYHLIAGRLNPENNIDRVVEAYAASSPIRPLLVLGTANYDSPVQNRLNEIAARSPLVRLIGHVNDRTAFLTLLGQAASYLHGHSVGGMNPSLVEAMHAGALVVAYDTPFNRETVGDAGLLFTFDDGGVERAIRTVDELSPIDAKELRERARTRVTERFAVDAVTNAYEALLAAALQAPSTRRVAIQTAWSP